MKADGKADWIDWLLAPFAPIIIWWYIHNPPSPEPEYPPEHYHRLQ